MYFRSAPASSKWATMGLFSLGTFTWIEKNPYIDINPIQTISSGVKNLRIKEFSFI